MIIGVPKELQDGENRVSAIPATVKEFTKKGIDVYVESGAGDGSFISNEEYENSGAKIVDRNDLYLNSDIIIKVNSPIINNDINECDLLKDESIFVSFFQTTRELKTVKELQKKNFIKHVLILNGVVKE